MLGIFCIDLIGRYQFTPKGLERKYQKTNKNVESVYLQAVTMIDPVTGWFEVARLRNGPTIEDAYTTHTNIRLIQIQTRHQLTPCTVSLTRLLFFSSAPDSNLVSNVVS